MFFNEPDDDAALSQRVDEALRKISPSGDVPSFGFPSSDEVDDRTGAAWLFSNKSFFFDSKSEAKDYLEDLDEVERCILVLKNFLSTMSERQRPDLDYYWHQSSLEGDAGNWQDVQAPAELSVGKIAAMQGISRSLYSVLEFLEPAIQEHKSSVSKEIEKFWSGRGRSKTWKAYYIARKIASIYYKEHRKPPTFGVNQDGNPSTVYTSVVSEVFDILGIDVGFKEPARWAKGKIDKGHSQLPPETVFEDRYAMSDLMKKISESGSLNKAMLSNQDFIDDWFEDESDEEIDEKK